MKTPFELLFEGSFLEILGVIFIFQSLLFFLNLFFRRKIKKQHNFSQIDIDIYESMKNFFICAGFGEYASNNLALIYIEKFRMALKKDFSYFEKYTNDDFRKIGESKITLDKIINIIFRKK